MAEDYIRRPNTSCFRCGKPVYRRPNEIKRALRAYCSRKCQDPPNVTVRSERVCHACGKSFFVPKNLLKKKFCSRGCANTSRRGMRYTGSNAINHRAALLIELQKLCGHAHCMVVGCYYSRTFDLHRLKEGKGGGKYTVGNAFAICPNHHAEVHRGLVTLREIGSFKLEAIDTGLKSQLDKYMGKIRMARGLP